MAGERFREATIEARLRDLDGSKHLKCRLAYGTIYVRGLPGGDFDVALFGPGGGFADRRVESFDRLHDRIETGLEHGGEAETDYGLFPDDPG